MKNKFKKFVYKNKINILLITFIIALIINIVSVSTIVYFKNNNKTIVHEMQTQLLTINNSINTDKQNDQLPIEDIEEKPIVIKKGKMNDKEDGEKTYTDSSMSNAKESSIDDALNLYETSGTSVGIDVSKYQKDINWSQVKNSGVEFAIIRCGYRGYGSGEILMDPYFEQNITGALKNGIKVGIYFYSAAINENEAKEEARWVVNVIKKYKITYPVAYDYESFGLGRLEGLSVKQNTDNAIAFLKYIKSAGYTPMMYASRNAYYQRWETQRITGCKFWLAHYNVEKSDYTGTYHMWQYTSKGTVPGINGYVDMDIAYFSYSKDIPAKEQEEEKKTDNNTPTTPEKVTITFNETNDNMITINETEYFNDYNDKEKAGVIPANYKIYRKAISEDTTWSKVSFDGKDVYVKTSCLNVDNNEN